MIILYLRPISDIRIGRTTTVYDDGDVVHKYRIHYSRCKPTTDVIITYNNNITRRRCVWRQLYDFIAVCYRYYYNTDPNKWILLQMRYGFRNDSARCNHRRFFYILSPLSTPPPLQLLYIIYRKRSAVISLYMSLRKPTRRSRRVGRLGHPLTGRYSACIV
jgi:hypothetical protein